MTDTPAPRTRCRRLLADSVEKVLRNAHAYFLRVTGAVDAVKRGGTTSIYVGSLCDLPSFAGKAFLVRVRPELISARFLRRHYFRLFQQYRPR